MSKSLVEELAEQRELKYKKECEEQDEKNRKIIARQEKEAKELEKKLPEIFEGIKHLIKKQNLEKFNNRELKLDKWSLGFEPNMETFTKKVTNKIIKMLENEGLQVKQEKDYIREDKGCAVEGVDPTPAYWNYYLEIKW